MRRMRIANPTASDLAHFALLRLVERNQLEAERIEAEREHQEWLAAKELRRRFDARPRVPARFGLDNEARRLGCEDEYENDLEARYGYS